MSNSPKFISDTPNGDDFFKIHSQIAETLHSIIKSENLSKHSFTIGLLGAWGSGKSLIIRKLKDKLISEERIIYLEFDVWKYIDTSLYRSILIDLDKELKNGINVNHIPEELRNGYETDKGESLYDLLYNHTEHEVPQLKKSKKGFWKKIFSYIKERVGLVFLVIVFFIMLICAYSFKDKIHSLIPFTTSSTFKFNFNLIVTGIIGVTALEFLKEFFKDFFKEMVPKVSKNIIITSPPTFAQDQFESIFKAIIRKLSVTGNKKVVLVFDNIDRCETNIALQVLTGLKTFLDEPNCFYIIPCDDKRIKDHFKETSKTEDDFLDKIFQAYLRIPILAEENRIGFIEKCIKDADFNLSHTDSSKIIQILTFAYKGETPRQIKRFFNDFISYYKLAQVIDPENKFLLKDISLFTFMISIKQKWPSVEEIIVEIPSFFQEYKREQFSKRIHIDCCTFIEKCISWIDLEANPFDFIYLKEAKQTGNNVYKIIIEGSDDFELNRALINSIDKLLDSFLNGRKHIFLEIGIERIKVILETYLKQEDNFLGIELFKVYVGQIISHTGQSVENRKKLFLISHSSFIIENIALIQKLDINKIDFVENNFANNIMQIGYETVTMELYKVFVKAFKPKNIATIFENVHPGLLEKVQPFIILTDPDTSLKIYPHSFLIQLANSLTFNRDETNTVNVFVHLKGKQELNPIFQSISDKLIGIFRVFFQQPNIQPQENFILKGLSICSKETLVAADKNNLGSYIRSRINIFFPQNHGELAIDYIIHGIRLGLPHMESSFISNGNNINLNQHQYFISFIKKIDPIDFELALNNQQIRDNVLRISVDYKIHSSVIAKLSTDYILSNIDVLTLNYPEWLVCMLEQATQRKEGDLYNEKLIGVEKTILDSYASHHKDLIFPHYKDVVPRLINQINKSSFIEKAINYYIPTVSDNSIHIINLLGYCSHDNKALIDKLYEANKILFQSIDNIVFFDLLFANNSQQSRNDYIDRVLSRNESNLKSGHSAGVILQSLHEKIDTETLNQKRNQVSSIISELLEPSRAEIDNIIGVNLFNKLRGDNKKFDEDFIDKLNTLKNNEVKSAALKELIAGIINLN